MAVKSAAPIKVPAIIAAATRLGHQFPFIDRDLRAGFSVFGFEHKKSEIFEMAPFSALCAGSELTNTGYRFIAIIPSTCTPASHTK